MHAAIGALAMSGMISTGISLVFLTQLDQLQAEQVTTVTEIPQLETMVSQDAIIDISGAVNSPGIVHVPSDSRLSQVIEKSGGFTADADSNFIAKNLNLAQKIQDGQKIFIPAKGENPSINSSSAPVKEETAIGGTGFVLNINTATLEELDTLPGIGESRATAIIEQRPYLSSQELVEKKIISQSIFNSIKAQISAD